MTSPLMIEIGLWYHCRTTDFRDGDLEAVAVRDALFHFVETGLLTQGGSRRKYEPTDGLRVWIETLCGIKLPVQKWTIPEGIDPPPCKPITRMNVAWPNLTTSRE